MSICHAMKHLTLDLSSVESDCTGGLLQKYYTGEQPTACYTVFLHMIFGLKKQLSTEGAMHTHDNWILIEVRWGEGKDLEAHITSVMVLKILLSQKHHLVVTTNYYC